MKGSIIFLALSILTHPFIEYGMASGNYDDPIYISCVALDKGWNNVKRPVGYHCGYDRIYSTDLPNDDE